MKDSKKVFFIDNDALCVATWGQLKTLVRESFSGSDEQQPDYRKPSEVWDALGDMLIYQPTVRQVIEGKEDVIEW